MNRRKGAPYFLGIDVGSVSVNTVILTEQKLIAEEYYHRHHGQPLATVRSVLKDIFSRIPPVDFVDISFVGTGGKLPAELLSVRFANEIVAQCKATEFFHPNIKTVIEMGGEDSKLIILDHDKDLTTSKLVNFSMNTMCAAGTGSFLDQQAHRLNVTIEEFGQLALKSKNPSSIAGRCSVFAKSDMIHLQQIATPDHDIIAGLCFALARNFKSTIGKGYTFHPPLAFQGGVAANVGMRRAFAGILALAPHEIIIPRHFASMGAIGACLMAIGSPSLCTPWTGWRRFDESGASAPRETATEAPLSFLCRNPVLSKAPCFPVQRGGKIRGYLGLDVGSISTNLVVINENRRVLAKRYLMTTGRPIEAIKRGLREIGEELNGSIEIAGAGATGSGRYLTGDFVGADVIRNEITAQATASANIDCEVDTIFEIGGQDSKYISLKNGAVVDFEMNKVCAAGTGSFLEEQAEKLGISIEKEFGTMALAAPTPVALGDRCTVFIESDLVHHQQRGAEKENLVAGLCYSIVRNYLNKVVSTKKIGDRIFFQGGTAFNEGVVAAFEKVLGKRITVPPDNEVTGAIGAAILAMKEKDDEPSRFKGFDLSRREYLLSSFPCNGCANMCEIHKLEVKDEKPLFYGGRCEKWEIKRSKKNISDIPDLFSERDELLHRFQEQNNRMPVSAPSVGIPRVLFFHDLLPFWGTYFNGLGFRVVLSEQTNRTIIRKGLETVVTETCFPIKVTHGHILDLIEKGVSAIFLPSLITLKRLQRHIKHSYSCPYVQSVPYTIQSTIDFKESGVVLLHPPVFMGRELHMLGK
ncbi:MAG: CoA activase, partial [Deltaproteobacteria bacterium]|nr:CoA activase [Deltaproteobacteria bacterium]